MSIKKIARLCIFGNPVKQSISPEIHTAFAKQFNLSITYEKIECAFNGFEDAVIQFKNQGGYGANITSPFKERAFALCDAVSDRARIAKSVNTFLFQDNKIFGDNTDGVGLVRDIQKNLSFSLQNKKIILLGAGGAARGIIKPILDERPNTIFIFNRTIEKAKAIATEFKIQYLTSLENNTADIVIDCLPANTGLLLPNTFSFSENSLFYDLKYQQTMMQNNASIKKNGKGMVIEQAAEAFYVWFEIKTDITLIKRAFFDTNKQIYLK